MVSGYPGPRHVELLRVTRLPSIGYTGWDNFAQLGDDYVRRLEELADEGTVRVEIWCGQCPDSRLATVQTSAVGPLMVVPTYMVEVRDRFAELEGVRVPRQMVFTRGVYALEPPHRPSGRLAEWMTVRGAWPPRLGCARHGTRPVDVDDVVQRFRSDGSQVRKIAV